MGERRALGVAGGAAGELDVDRVVELQLARELAQLGDVGRRRQIAQSRRNASMPGVLCRRGGSRGAGRQRVASQMARLGVGELRRQRPHHADVVAGLEAGARISARQPTLLSAYSSSCSR